MSGNASLSLIPNWISTGSYGILPAQGPDAPRRVETRRRRRSALKDAAFTSVLGQWFQAEDSPEPDFENAVVRVHREANTLGLNPPSGVEMLNEYYSPESRSLVHWFDLRSNNSRYRSGYYSEADYGRYDVDQLTNRVRAAGRLDQTTNSTAFETLEFYGGATSIVITILAILQVLAWQRPH